MKALLVVPVTRTVRPIEFDGSERGLRFLLMGGRDPQLQTPGNFENPSLYLERDPVYHFKGLYKKYRLPVGFAESLFHVQDYDAPHWPRTFILDRDGEVRGDFTGVGVFLGELDDGTFHDVFTTPEDLLAAIEWNVRDPDEAPSLKERLARLPMAALEDLRSVNKKR